MRPKFIPGDTILRLQVDLIERYGGSHGIGDKGLKAMLRRNYLHRTIFDKAAAYGYHLCQNHPFVDGNKRIALVAMDIFLQMNDYELIADEESTYTMITLVAQGKMSKKGLAKWVKGNCSKEKLTKLRDVI